VSNNCEQCGIVREEQTNEWNWNAKQEQWTDWMTTYFDWWIEWNIIDGGGWLERERAKVRE